MPNASEPACGGPLIVICLGASAGFGSGVFGTSSVFFSGSGGGSFGGGGGGGGGGMRATSVGSSGASRLVPCVEVTAYQIEPPITQTAAPTTARRMIFWRVSSSSHMALTLLFACYETDMRQIDTAQHVEHFHHFLVLDRGIAFHDDGEIRRQRFLRAQAAFEIGQRDGIGVEENLPVAVDRDRLGLRFGETDRSARLRQIDLDALHARRR